MFSGKAINCSTIPYQIVGFRRCSSTSRFVCKNTTTITQYSYPSANCGGVPSTVNFAPGSCVDVSGEGYSYHLGCSPGGYFPDCYGKNAALDSTTICGGVGTCSSFNNCTGCGLYTGAECNVAPCYGVRANDAAVCGGKGTCSALNQCTCTSGWSGLTCTVPSCGGVNATNTNVCNGRGTCASLNQCNCNSGWSGSTCTVPSCGGVNATNSTVCSGNGDCTAPNNCTCKTGYTGSTCASPLCSGIDSTNATVCSGNGKCTAPNTCVCNTGRTGNNCQTSQTSSSVQYGISILILGVISLLF